MSFWCVQFNQIRKEGGYEKISRDDFSPKIIFRCLGIILNTTPVQTNFIHYSINGGLKKKYTLTLVHLHCGLVGNQGEGVRHEGGEHLVHLVMLSLEPMIDNPEVWNWER